MAYVSVIVGALAIIVAIGIAVWQQRRVEQKASQRALRQARESDLTEMAEHLKALEDVESEVREQGPVDSDAINARRLDFHSRRLRNIADRSPDGICDPLRAVAAAADRLRSIDVPAETKVMDEYAKVFATTPPTAPGAEFTPRALARTAIYQQQAAADLRKAIDAAWSALRAGHG
jgi:hypothetical protein